MPVLFMHVCSLQSTLDKVIFRESDKRSPITVKPKDGNNVKAKSIQAIHLNPDMAFSKLLFPAPDGPIIPDN